MLAIDYFERAIEMDPSFARAYAGLSDSYASRYWGETDQELLDKAESAAEYALLLDDQSAEAFVALGHTKIIKRDYAGAEMVLKRALELNPNDARAYSWLIYAYRREDRKEEAFAILQKVLELNPMSGELNSEMGLYVQELRGADWDTVFMYWKRAIERDPDHPLAYFFSGGYYRWTGQLDQAIPYFNKVVDLTTGPTKVGWAEGHLTSIYTDIGDYKSAAQIIRRMREFEPDNFGATNSEIHLLLSRGNFSAARDMVHRMLSKHIDSDSITGLMAFYEMLIGDTNHAEEIYARLAADQEPSGVNGQVNLYRRAELGWGMMGAVNLAYCCPS